MSTVLDLPRLLAPPVPARVRRGRALGLGCALALLALAVVASVTFGARDVAPTDVWAGVLGRTGTTAQSAVALRVPRTVLAVLVGAALAVAGVLMQGVTRNPLADPGILGVSGGASFAVVCAITVAGLSSAWGYALVACLGAAVASGLVYGLASLRRGGPTPLGLTLAGAVTSAALASLTSAVMLPRAQAMDAFRFWQIGGVGGADLARTLALVPLFVVGFALALLLAGPLDAVALGDDVAAGLGEHVGRTRALSALAAVLLCGGATALAGPIGFVGLVVPHACRSVSGPHHRWLIPFSAVAGGVLLVLADVVGRVVARPAEVEVGVVTALIGAPVFIALVRRRRSRAL